MYKVRMGSFPCAWSREGADAVARLRSWAASGMALPRRTREGLGVPPDGHPPWRGVGRAVQGRGLTRGEGRPTTT